VTTLGYGRRIGIWFQGCSIRCKGCCSLDTWEADPAYATTVEQVLEWIAAKPLDEVDGFTISGGEPFDQKEALHALLQGLTALRGDPASKRDILVYSGFPWKTVLREHSRLLQLADAVVSEPYVQALASSTLAGSKNQVLRSLTDLGRSRYKLGSESGASRTMQMHLDGKRLWLIGIPDSQTLDLVAEQLLGSGVLATEVSWRA
jgi:anaerobic ribonucleoside-triphosphate reductase activating protein